jgi:polygalacturonase
MTNKHRQILRLGLFLGIGMAGVLCAVTAAPAPQVLSVGAFGAAGDDATDDSGAIARAIAASTEGDTILFPPGTYKLNKRVILSSGRTYSGQPGAIVRGPHNDFAFATPYDNTRDIGITGLVLEGSGLMLDGSGVPASNISITNCTFQNILSTSDNWTSHNAIFIASGLTNGVISHNAFRNILEAGKTDPADRNANGIQGWRVSMTSIADNTFDTVNQGVSIQFNGPGPYRGVVIARNTGVRVHRMGIEVQGANTEGLLVEGNTFSDFLQPFWNTYGLSIVPDGGTNTIIRNNVLVGSPTSSIRYGYGIEASGHGTSVTDNRIQGLFSAGIAVGTSDNIVVTNNYLCGSAGTMQIMFESGPQPGAVITPNTSEPACR